MSLASLDTFKSWPLVVFMLNAEIKDLTPGQDSLFIDLFQDIIGI